MKTTKQTGVSHSVVHETTGARHFTTVTEKQTFMDGQYAGKSYRITTMYVSNAPGYRGQFLKSSSEPWKEI